MADVEDAPVFAELANLIGSLNIDLEKHSRPQRSKNEAAQSNNPQSESLPEDTEDYTVVHFGSKQISFRGQQGRYLSVQSVSGGKKEHGTNSSNSTHGPSFIVGMNGQGIGEVEDALVAVNADNREDTGPIRFGMTVSFRSIYAKERLMCRVGAGGNNLPSAENTANSRVGFVRNLAGNAEKWVILKALTSTSVDNNAGGFNMRSVRSSGSEEEPGSFNTFVRNGDHVVLQAIAPKDYILALHEGIDGREVRMQHKDKVIHSYDHWQIEIHGGPSLPSWHKRPYLSGRFIAIPPSNKMMSPEIEARYFPVGADSSGPSKLLTRLTGGVQQRHKNMSSVTQDVAAPLNSFSAEQQHDILLRELLLVLSGYEGGYIRIAASSSNGPVNASSGAKSQSSGSPYMRSINLVMDADSADKSIVSQVGQLLPICEHVIHLKDYIRVHSRYEYGLVSHAFAAELQSLLCDYENIVIQLECLVSQNKLTMQKMVYFLQPSKVVIRVLHHLCSNVVKDATGGLLIDLLYQSIQQQGDEKAREIHKKLFDAAAEPYFKMLQLWLFRGELHDIYNEFMIQENTSISKESMQDDFNAQYWDDHYTVIKDSRAVPQILQPYAHKILTAGKYLNVVRNNILADTNSSLLGHQGQDEESRKQYDQRRRRHEHKKIMKSMGKLLTTFPIAFTLSRSGGLESRGAHAPLISTSTISSAISVSVESAHDFSSRALLRLLEDKYSLSEHFRSLRRFFLLEHGDFFVQFMDTAEEELRRDVAEVSIARIQTLLQQALQTSTLHSDPYRELLTCSLAPHNLIQHLHLIQSAGAGAAGMSDAAAGGSLMMNASPSSGLAAFAPPNASSQGLKGVEALTLDYKVEWPLSIVLSRRSFTKYQLLSRLLFFSKHVEVRVLRTWSGHMDTKSLAVRGVMGPSYALRHRMLHFLQNFVYYMCLEVISPRAHEMKVGLHSASNMDDVIQLHDKFLDMCLKECLLASQHLLKILTKIMTTCLLFSDQMKRFSGNIDNHCNIVLTNSTRISISGSGRGRVTLAGSPTERKGRSGNYARDSGLEASIKSQQQLSSEVRKVQTDYIVKEVNHEAYRRLLNKFSDTFDSQLFEFLDTLWKDSHRYHPQLSNLCVRLDYNGFYSGRISNQAGSSAGNNMSTPGGTVC